LDTYYSDLADETSAALKSCPFHSGFRASRPTLLQGFRLSERHTQTLFVEVVQLPLHGAFAAIYPAPGRVLADLEAADRQLDFLLPAKRAGPGMEHRIDCGNRGPAGEAGVMHGIFEDSAAAAARFTVAAGALGPGH
jgi:hypothetical protein